MASESGCPIEMHRIDIEPCDEMYDQECRGNRYMPFHRAGYDRKTGQSPNRPREQVIRNLICPETLNMRCVCNVSQTHYGSIHPKILTDKPFVRAY
jgi:hypothetical protein